jgi:hypothetical protein
MLDEPLFSIGRVAKAAGSPAATVRGYKDRGLWQPDRFDEAPEAHGLPSRLTLRRALHIGTALHAIRQGIDPALAFAAAYAWTDLADPCEAPGFSREAGCLFDGANVVTALAIYPSAQHRWQVFRVDTNPPSPDGKTNPTQPNWPFFPPYAGQQDSGFVFWLNRIDFSIRRALRADG